MNFGIFLVFLSFQATANTCPGALTKDDLAKSTEVLRSLGLENKVVIKAGNASLLDAEVVVIGQPHQPDDVYAKTVVQKAGLENVGVQGAEVTNTLLKYLARDGDLLLLEGVAYLDKLWSWERVASFFEGSGRLEGYRNLVGPNVRIDGWENFRTFLVSISVLRDRTTPISFVTWLTFQRTVFMTNTILHAAQQLGSGHRVIVSCGTLHAEGAEGVLFPALTKSSRKFVVLGPSAPSGLSVDPDVWQKQADWKRSLKVSADLPWVNNIIGNLGLPATFHQNLRTQDLVNPK